MTETAPRVSPAPALAESFFLPNFCGIRMVFAVVMVYQEVWRHLQPQVGAPDLVVLLQARPEILMQRVLRRGNDFERNLGEEYLFRLVQAYGNYFPHYDAAPVLMVNSENLNPVENTADFDLLLERIERMRGPREYFSRGA